MKINSFIFTVPKTVKWLQPLLKKWEIHPGYAEKLSKKTILHSNIQLPNHRTPLFFMPFNAYLLISKTSNIELVQATFPHPQAPYRHWMEENSKE